MRSSIKQSFAVAMPETLEISPVTRPVVGMARPPGSKSITNRALVCAALAHGQSTLTGALDSEDTRVMIDAIRKLGVSVDALDRGETLVVTGCDGVWPAKKADLFVANSGTTMRFLTAAAALGRGEYRLDGVARMRERPIGDLVDALAQLGVDATTADESRCPPVELRANGLSGGRATIAGNISSQFLSGVMMAAPYARQPVELAVSGELASIPYLAMTARVMESFGAAVTASSDYRAIRVDNTRRYAAREYVIEPDASAASYFFAAAAVTGGRVTVEGLSRDSLQGDVAFCDCLAQMGADVAYGENSITVAGRQLRGVDVDMNAISDTAPTLAVVALFAAGPTRIRNVGHMRHKETDRIAAVAAELRKLGATVEETADGLAITPSAPHGAAIDTYNDHRMAMSFAIAGLKISGVIIRDPACVGKTYPRFFEDLARIVGA